VLPLPVRATQAGMRTTTLVGALHEPEQLEYPNRIPCATVAWEIMSKICLVVKASTPAPLPVKWIEGTLIT
jgi:hypothetical protein